MMPGLGPTQSTITWGKESMNYWKTKILKKKVNINRHISHVQSHSSLVLGHASARSQKQNLLYIYLGEGASDTSATSKCPLSPVAIASAVTAVHRDHLLLVSNAGWSEIQAPVSRDQITSANLL